MKNILVINLKRFGDIICSANLINNLKNKYPRSKISLLVYECSVNATKVLPNIHEVYTINREEVLMYLKNKLFPDTVALQSFIDDLTGVKNERWDSIINYSNDKLSSILISYLNPEYFYGVKTNENNLIEYSNEWAVQFNEVLTSRDTVPVNVIESLHKTCDIEMEDKNNKLLSNQDFNKITYKNFNDLRKKYQTPETPHVSVVGIQVKTSSVKKDIPLDQMVDLI